MWGFGVVLLMRLFFFSCCVPGTCHGLDTWLSRRVFARLAVSGVNLAVGARVGIDSEFVFSAAPESSAPFTFVVRACDKW